MVTAAEAEKILAEGKKIDEDLVWRPDMGGTAFRLEAAVFSIDSNKTLRLVGYVGKKNRSFALLYRNSPIRKYTVHDRHKDPVTRIVYTQPHKHCWDDEYEDKRVYIPDDIRIGDPNNELADFLKECNIKLKGLHTPPLMFFQINQGGRQ